MFNLGLFEITLFGVIALVVLGPDKLLVAARTLGKWYAIFLRTKERLQTDVMYELNLLETQRQIQAELAKLKSAEVKIQQQMDVLQGQITQNHRQIRQALTLDDEQNQPMQGRFFLLSAYERQRRLPNAPFLPNYQADKLLSQLTNHHN